jgi:hypothetical protein
MDDSAYAQTTPDGVANSAEPTMEELLERLAALRVNIRRARERYLENGARNPADSAAGGFPTEGG